MSINLIVKNFFFIVDKMVLPQYGGIAGRLAVIA